MLHHNSIPENPMLNNILLCPDSLHSTCEIYNSLAKLSIAKLSLI